MQEKYMFLKPSGAGADEHVLGAVGLVLHVGAGRAAAQLGHGLHEPADHRATSCKQVSNSMIMCGP